MIGKWHLSRIADSSYTYDGAKQTVQGCGFDYVEALFVENLASDGEFNNYSDGSFSHNMEWITVEAINFINDQSTSVSTKCVFSHFCDLLSLQQKLTFQVDTLILS